MTESKNGSIPWMGKIPNHWKIKKIKYCGSATNGLTYSPGQLRQVGVPVLRSSNIKNTKLDFADTVYVDSQTAKDTLLKRGDILICACNGSAELVGKSVYIEKDNEYSFGSFMKRFRSDLGKFGFYVLNSDVFNYHIPLFSTTTINQLTNKAFGDIEIPIPPKEEQKQITAFLDDRCQIIDQSIEKKSQQLESLKIYQKSIIAKIVTTGLNPEALSIDSKISWIGTIPKHWKVLRLANCFSLVKREPDLSKPLLTVSIHSGISDRELGDEDRDRKIWFSEDRSKYQGIKAGDIVYNMMRAWQGAFGASVVDGLVSPAYVVMEPKEGIDSKYFEMLFRTPSIMQAIDGISQGIADFRKRLYWEKARDLLLPVPPYEEQKAIVESLANMDDVSEVVAKLEQQIKLLHEYRSSLINAAVTGKLNINEVENVA